MEHFRDVGGDGWRVGADDLLREGADHVVNARNEITELASTDGFGPAGAEAPAYDGAGNLVFDGRWFYVYDPWNRLAAVHGRGSLVVGAAGLEGEAGPCVERFEYDALGRRVRTALWPESSAERVTRHVYGTGAAVLEEYESTPAVEGGGGGGGGSGGPENEVLARWFLPGFGGASAATGFPDMAAMYDLTDAGNVPAGDAEEVLFYLRDALGSVVALTDESGAVVERP